MLKLLHENIPDTIIKEIVFWKKPLRITIRTIDEDDTYELFYKTEYDYNYDKEICEDWLKNVKPEIDKNKSLFEFKNNLVNALDTIKQVCEFYVDDDCVDCPLKDSAETCIFEYGYAPVVWGIYEEDPIIEIETYV